MGRDGAASPGFRRYDVERGSSHRCPARTPSTFTRMRKGAAKRRKREDSLSVIWNYTIYNSVYKHINPPPKKRKEKSS